MKKIRLYKTLHPSDTRKLYYAGTFQSGEVGVTDNKDGGCIFPSIQEAHKFVEKSKYYWTISIT